jgi:hypothetical protein
MSKFGRRELLALFIKSTSILAVAAVASTMAITAQAETMTQSLVQNYASSMKSAANSKNIGQISRLVSDDALISLSRNGRTTSLDKDAYVKLLQRSWNQTSDYNYDIDISNIVISGSQAKANVTTTESWVKDGIDVSFVTTSRVTLSLSSGNAVLLRAVSQVSID